jgi:hypothetical protein
MAKKLNWDSLTETERAAQITYVERQQKRDNDSGKEKTELTREDIAMGFAIRIFKPTRRAVAK